MGEPNSINRVFYADMRNIIMEARENAVRGVEYARLTMYRHLGERIFAVFLRCMRSS
ncbi:MAG: hypothetical protein LBT62_07620 [Deltaproteobacteria bacterium]|jgi:hypothetical protein|nr:hypothetical protein [Deltaproteobacteria bacterium]